MAAITTVQAKNSYRETTTTSSAVTRWLTVPAWAKYANITLTPTAITTNVTFTLPVADPGLLDDTYQIPLKAALTGGPVTTVNTTQYVAIGPGITPADALAIGTTADSWLSINTPLPSILGITVTPSGSCTFTLSVAFRA